MPANDLGIVVRPGMQAATEVGIKSGVRCTPDEAERGLRRMAGDRSRESRRKAIPKSLRFEVLKRDRFQCRYCGAAAPDVLLQIDHMTPVANGGDNDITNLITACAACNAGKRDKLLDDHTLMNKRKAQLDELQERREQLEMMMEWAQSLRELKDESVGWLVKHWSDLAPGYVPNDEGIRDVKRWLRRFTFMEITHAMDVAADQYLSFLDDGSATKGSWEFAFDKIPGICAVARDSREDPDLRELLYIRGIVRNKCEGDCDEAECLELLRAARDRGVRMVELRHLAYRTRRWSHFKSMIREITDDGEDM